MNGLVADRRQIAQFVSALFPYATLGTWAQLRSFFDKGESLKGPAAAFEAILLTENGLGTLVDRATRYATRSAMHRHRVVFCPPICTFQTARSAAAVNLADVLAVSVECDERAVEAVATLSGIIGPPTVTVASGGYWVDPSSGEITERLHAHWRLSKAANTSDAIYKAHLARRLARAIVGSDSTNDNPVHPIRWPGSWHRKFQPARMARIVRINESIEIDLENALAKLIEAAIDVGAARYDEGASPAENSEKTADMADVTMWMHGIPNPEPGVESSSDKHWGWWNRIGMALWGATKGSAEGLALFHEWSAKHEKYDAAFTARRWAHWHRCPPTKLGAGTLCYLFTEYWSEPAFCFVEFDCDG
jgi:hypothetical protein